MAQVRYIVRDVEQATKFYLDHLGFRLVQQFAPAIAIIERDDLRLWLAGPQASASRPMPVDDLDSVVGRLRDGGVVFRNEIVTGPGGRQILCEDPSGNPIELFEPA
jgi:catechol 2,3-dioxygenase-like lactoylglutathione lyase family enzyme